MSNAYISPNAKRIIETICDEFALQSERVAGGFLSPDRVHDCMLERLNAKSKSDDGLRAFLSDVGPIDPEDDTSADRDWAEDPRDDSFHEVRHGPGSPTGLKRTTVAYVDEVDHPMPGERVC